MKFSKALIGHWRSVRFSSWFDQVDPKVVEVPDEPVMKEINPRLQDMYMPPVEEEPKEDDERWTVEPTAFDVWSVHGSKNEYVGFDELDDESKSSLMTYFTGKSSRDIKIKDPDAHARRFEYKLKHVPTPVVKDTILKNIADTVKRNNWTWTEYQDSFFRDELPTHKSRWPVLRFEEAIPEHWTEDGDFTEIGSGKNDWRTDEWKYFEDGYHRLHSYVKAGDSTIPFLSARLKGQRIASAGEYDLEHHYWSNLTSEVENFIDRHASRVNDRFFEWGDYPEHPDLPPACDVASLEWMKEFYKHDIKDAQMMSGNFSERDDSEADYSSLSDHVWIQFPNGGIFDPTASQFVKPHSISFNPAIKGNVKDEYYRPGEPVLDLTDFDRLKDNVCIFRLCDNYGKPLRADKYCSVCGEDYSDEQMWGHVRKQEKTGAKGYVNFDELDDESKSALLTYFSGDSSRDMQINNPEKHARRFEYCKENIETEEFKQQWLEACRKPYVSKYGEDPHKYDNERGNFNNWNAHINSVSHIKFPSYTTRWPLLKFETAIPEHWVDEPDVWGDNDELTLPEAWKVFEDGYHRFHSYVAAGDKTIPRLTGRLKQEKKARIMVSAAKTSLNLPISDTLHNVLQSIGDSGKRGLIVGGAVRDAMLGEEPKDIDVEVYGSDYDSLVDTLAQHGRVDVVGKSFGVIKLTDKNGDTYDFSLPRRDSKTGIGHRDFKIDFDPDITPPEAASRRDFTINSMAYDPLSGELHDYFGGKQDLEDKVLRHTTDAFAEDPLRVLRGMQFASRFGLDVHPDTARFSQSISDEYDSISKERVAEEFMKLATKGREPGKAIKYLRQTGWSKNFPAIHNLFGVPQDPDHHPEGDVAAHTMHTMNAAARIADREGLEGDDRATIILAAMSHDLGKATHTQMEDDGRITSHGHDRAGADITHDFLNSIGIKPDITARVVPLVKAHMKHLDYHEHANPKTVRRLASSIYPSTIGDLALIMEADHSGRPPRPAGLPDGAKHMLRLAEDSQVTEEPMKPLLLGRHVMPYFSEPGPHIGEVLKAAYEAQLEGHINNEDEAQGWLQNYMSTKTAARKKKEVDPNQASLLEPQIDYVEQRDEAYDRDREIERKAEEDERSRRSPLGEAFRFVTQPARNVGYGDTCMNNMMTCQHGGKIRAGQPLVHVIDPATKKVLFRFHPDDESGSSCKQNATDYLHEFIQRKP